MLIGIFAYALVVMLKFRTVSSDYTAHTCVSGRLHHRVALLRFFISQTGISLSSLSDGMVVLHMPSEDNKQKVRVTQLLVRLSSLESEHSCVALQGDAVLQCSHAIELVTKLSWMARKVNYVNVSPGR